VARALDTRQPATAVDWAERRKERLVHGFLATGILEGPVDLAATAGELARRIRASRDALLDGGKTLFSLRL
jgi:hypothetical protein